MIDKNRKPSKLLWIDLEMTGLDPSQDVIIEVAAEITDFDFNTLATYETLVKQPSNVVLKRMQANAWWQDFPENRDQFIANIPNGKTLANVEKELVDIVENHFGQQPAILAGNSIYNDRLFIKRWLPGLDVKLHYRMLDVSSFKILMHGKYNKLFKKPEVHRAFEDIQGSIAELQYYLDYLNDGIQKS